MKKEWRKIILEVGKRIPIIVCIIMLFIVNVKLYLDKEILQYENSLLEKRSSNVNNKNIELNGEITDFSYEISDLSCKNVELNDELDEVKKELIEVKRELDLTKEHLKAQLNREIVLEEVENEKMNLPVVKNASEIPLAGYQCDTISEAKEVPINFISEYDEMFLRLDFSRAILEVSEENFKFILIEPNGNEVGIEIQEEMIFLPVKKGIRYVLKVTNNALSNRINYLAFIIN